MPRKARFHTYPIIGRFADFARKRAYLWSFRSSDVRPAIYVGSILAFQPVMGIQTLLAFALAVLLRRNAMVLVGLQFITNPFTAVPAYYLTHQVGMAVIRHSGWGESIKPAEELHIAEGHDFTPPSPELHEVSPPPQEPATRLARWTSRIGTEINALIIGGVAVGLAVGGIIDLIWTLSVSQTTARRRKLLSAQSQPPPASSDGES